MKRIVVTSIALAAALAGYLYWASDERQIRRLLERVADAVSHDGTGGVAGLAEVAGLTSDLSPDVTLDPGAPFRTIDGAQNVVSTVGRLRAVTTAVRLELLDAEVVVDGGSASVQAMARLTLRDREGVEEQHAREVITTLVKRDGAWVVTTARALGVIASP